MMIMEAERQQELYNIKDTNDFHNKSFYKGAPTRIKTDLDNGNYSYMNSNNQNKTMYNW